MKTQRPKQMRLGRIKATIWENDKEDGSRSPRVVFSKLYKNGEGWKQCNTFGRRDLLLLAKLIGNVHSDLYQTTQN